MQEHAHRFRDVQKLSGCDVQDCIVSKWERVEHEHQWYRVSTEKFECAVTGCPEIRMEVFDGNPIQANRKDQPTVTV